MSSKNKQRAEARSRAASRKRRTRVLMSAAVAVVVLGAGAFGLREADRPGQSFPSQGRTHVPEGTTGFAYNSRPPTSGPHAAPARWGEHREPIAEVNQVHNLEHGGILIQYECDRLPSGVSCPETVAALRAVLKQAREEIDPKIVLAPFRNMAHPIAVTAWTRLEYFDRVDAEGILAFAEANVNRAPEQVTATAAR